VQYALLSAGPCRLLVTRPDTNAYGNATLNMAWSFQLARHLDAPLYVAPVNPERHTALTSLECDGVRRIAGTPRRTGAVLAAARILAGARRAHVPRVTAAGTLETLNGLGTDEERSYFGLDLRQACATQTLPIRLPAAVESDVRRRASLIGIPAERPIVTLHVRESGYKASLGYVDREKDVARNARIETYLPAVDWLVSRGYTVVRFGDPLMAPVERPGLVDVATSPHRDPALEIWCVLRSRFFVASDCGPFNLSVLTGVPCIGVNMTHLIGAYPLRRHDRYILKHVVDSETGRELTLADMLTREHVKHRWVPGRYRFIDNTPAEICEAVQEMEGALIDGEVGDAQRTFREAVAAFLDGDYGRAKQTKRGVQAAFYLGDGWVGEAFARRSLGLPSS